ncbi:hypothetical protein BJV74DRAFT_781774 [Russula compacta]|nr:hypothetical protein BJV74DRAFT_781774 [Russula compacta]
MPLSMFMNCCYIVYHSIMTALDITCFQHYLAEFYKYWEIFMIAGIWQDFSLPHQHALMYHPHEIKLFGSPNGICTSQTKAKHKPAVKNNPGTNLVIKSHCLK